MRLQFACALAALFCSGLALASDEARKITGSATAETMDVLAYPRVAVFFVATPDAEISAAWRDNSDRADKAGVVPPPTSGYVVTNRVIVRTDDPAALEALVAADPAFDFYRFDPAPGFWIVVAPSVRSAAAAAELLAAEESLAEVYLDIDEPKTLRSPTDPGYPNQWHLNNTSLPIADVNAEPAWNAGYTGQGAVIGILEGGWQYNHPDLAANYNSAATQSGGSSTSHGTACAGVAAAVAFNGLGGVGAAYGAGVSGQIYGSSSQTAAAFEFRNDLNDVKSNSWGPADDGTITYLPSIERTAIANSLATGRGGLGEVFTWAAGNGGTGDRVEYDPYASSRMTCAIGAIGDLDTRSYYNETGSSMLVVTESNGNSRGIYTTDLTGGAGYSSGDYTSSFGGTSSASPLAAGVVGLMLDANPDLTWRDVQHVLIHSARKCDPGAASWTTNATGLPVSYDYGFGACDAGAATALAATWTNVGAEVVVDTGSLPVNVAIPDNNTTGVTQNVEIPDNIRIESVEVLLNIDTTYVGDLRIFLTAPSGTTSLLANNRSDGQDDYVNYIFTSLRHWDEPSAGTWTLNISDRGAQDFATWQDWRVKIYGTSLEPLMGDMNCDGTFNNADIPAFVLALIEPGNYAATYPDCDILNGDIDGDGSLSNADIPAFVDLLAG